jgi:hypothetical protein
VIGQRTTATASSEKRPGGSHQFPIDRAAETAERIETWAAADDG